MNDLQLLELAQQYGDDDKAREIVEKMRWPNGPVCPHCQSTEAYKLTGKPDSKKPVRKGVYKCKACRKQFTVTVGTIFADSHIPLGKWLMAIYLMCASKKGVSAHQLHRMLKITYKSAWFLAHRIRHAMKAEPLASMLTGTVEVDEVYIGGRPRVSQGRKTKFQGRGTKKVPVVALVERGGKVRTKVIRKLTSNNLHAFIEENVDKSSTLMSDEYKGYTKVGRKYARHGVINHSRKVYAQGDVTTNTVEGFFSLLKRGVNGTFHHVSPQHLQRYCDEFSFRYDNRKVSDGERTAKAMAMVEGKRLMYREPIEKLQADS